MENTILNLLNEFSYQLDRINSKNTDLIEIVLPLELFMKAEREFYESTCIAANNHPDGKLAYITIRGTKFILTCKEVNEQALQRKLQSCFKVLST